MSRKRSELRDVWVDTVFSDRLNRSRPRAIRALAEWAAASVQTNTDVNAGISAGFAAVSRAAESPEVTVEAAHLAIEHAVLSLRAGARLHMDEWDVAEWHVSLHEAGELIGLRVPPSQDRQAA